MPLNLEQARFLALELMPYMSSALYSFKVIITERLDAPMAITRHGRLIVNPKMCGEISDEEVGTILLHETMHIISEHADRAEFINCDHKMWNYAADFEINDDLVSAGCRQPRWNVGTPEEKGMLDCRRYNYDTALLAEEYYDLLEKDHPQLKNHYCGSGAGNAAPGEEEFDGEGAGLSKEDIERIKNDVAVSMQEHIKKGGYVPCGMKRWAETILKGKSIDWKKQLARSIKKTISASRGIMNPTYNRISRRQHASKDIIIPAYCNIVPKIGVLLDTSGSMSERDLGDGLFQLKKIFSQMPEIEMWLAVVDAEVYSVSRVKTTRDIQAKIMGGGGTVFTEVFDKLLDVGCDLIVGISDCCASFPETTPKAKVVWVTSYKEANPPFGEVIIIDRSEEEEKQ